jgi:hypothetical protein
MMFLTAIFGLPLIGELDGQSGAWPGATSTHPGINLLDVKS